MSKSTERRFFTPMKLARELTMMVEDYSPSSVVDICAGSGNLLEACVERWPAASYCAVDIREVSWRAPDGVTAHAWHCDGRAFAARAVSEGTRFGLVVANPPFGKEETANRIRVRKWLSASWDMPAGRAYDGLVARVEVSMVLANAALVAEGGWLLAVLPQTVLAGARYRCLRGVLAGSFDVRSVMPLGAAFGPDISTCAVALRRVSPGGRESWGRHQMARTVWRAAGDGGEAVGCLVSETAAPGAASRSEFEVFRGRRSSRRLSRQRLGKAAIHVSDFGEDRRWRARATRWAIGGVSADDVVAERGDIVIARVGRRAGSCLLVGARVGRVVSDCVLVVRCQSDAARRLAEASLLSPAGLAAVRAKRRGLTVQFVTGEDVSEYLGSCFAGAEAQRVKDERDGHACGV